MFKQKFPLLVKNIQFPPLLKYSDLNMLVDLKQLSKDAENASGLRIFHSNFSRVHFFIRGNQGDASGADGAVKPENRRGIGLYPVSSSCASTTCLPKRQVEQGFVFKPSFFNDCLQELEDVITSTLQGLNFVKTQKLQLLGNIGETLVFDKIDQQIFNSQQRRETYVSELRRDGVILPI